MVYVRACAEWICASLAAPALRETEAACDFKNVRLSIFPKSIGPAGESLTTEMKKCVWVKPKLVAQIEFLEWTDAFRKTSELLPAIFAQLKPTPEKLEYGQSSFNKSADSGRSNL